MWWESGSSYTFRTFSLAFTTTCNHTKRLIKCHEMMLVEGIQKLLPLLPGQVDIAKSGEKGCIESWRWWVERHESWWSWSWSAFFFPVLLPAGCGVDLSPTYFARSFAWLRISFVQNLISFFLLCADYMHGSFLLLFHHRPLCLSIHLPSIADEERCKYPYLCQRVRFSRDRTTYVCTVHQVFSCTYFIVWVWVFVYAWLYSEESIFCV